MNIDITTYNKAKLYKPDGEHGYGPVTADGPAKRKPEEIYAIIIHTTNGNKGTNFDDEARFLYTSLNVSAHYLVGKRGQVIQFLDPLCIAWHAGPVNDGDCDNYNSIGIENHLTPGEQWTPEMRQSLTDLVIYLLQTYPSIRKVVTHRGVAVFPPGHRLAGKLGRKIDPSEWSDADFAVWAQEVLQKSHTATTTFTALTDLPIHEGPASTFPQALQGNAKIPSGEQFQVDKDMGNGWFHIANGLGFVDMSLKPISDPNAHRLGDFFAPPSISQEQVIKYTINSSRGSPYTPYDIRSIVGYYWNYATQAGLDPALLVAQMLHETGNLTSWWSARPRRNPAGIGVTGEVRRGRAPVDGVWQYDAAHGEYKRGYAFASWDMAARAHVGHILCYALTDQAMNEAQRALSGASPRKADLPAHYRGVATCITDLNGRWAVPGKNYGERILSIVEAMRTTS